MSNGRIWPYAISISIIIIFGACVATIVVATKLPVEKSDTYMMDYHESDAKANDIIKSRIAFNKKYKVQYITDGLNIENTVLKYKVTDLDNNPVNNAILKAVITRPNNRKSDQELLNPTVENGIYTFDGVKLPLAGRWDIMAKIDVGENQRFLNIKADTRESKISQY